MASTIQIKRGTGSAVPSGLADGELAINLDNGKLYFGSGSTSVNNFTFGELTAEKYIVSSSVLYVTTSYSSGSTEFGNSADDTHTFTGNITASGNISLPSDKFMYFAPEVSANTYIRENGGDLVLAGDDDIILTGKRHEFLSEYEVGFNDEGIIEGLKINLSSNCGMSPDLSAAIGNKLVEVIPGNVFSSRKKYLSFSSNKPLNFLIGT